MREICGDEMVVGRTKFYRVACFREIGGFVRQVMWDGIDDREDFANFVDTKDCMAVLSGLHETVCPNPQIQGRSRRTGTIAWTGAVARYRYSPVAPGEIVAATSHHIAIN